ncbi:MAG: hypothetical protein ACRD1R_11770 [Acidobacteriota bacterium]
MNSRSKALFWVVFIFLAGGAFGSVSTYLWMDRAPSQADATDHQHQDGKKESHPGKIMDRLSAELALNEQQTVNIRQILERSREQYKLCWNEARARSKEIGAKTRAEIMNALDSEQKIKFQEFLRRHDDRHHDDKK